MRDSEEDAPGPAPCRRVAVAAAMLASFLALEAPRPALADNPGHALAQRFADGGTTTTTDERRRAAEEAEMLARARQEAAERAAAQRRAAAEAERRDEEARKAELERFVNEAEAKQKEDERRAQDLKQAEEARQAEARRRAEQDRALKEALEKRLAAERAAKEAAEREAREAEERRAREVAEREAKEAEERRAREIAAREAKEAEERRAKEVAEREAREAEERRAREIAEREARQAQERQAREAAEREARAREARAAEARARYEKDRQEAEARRRLEAEREERTRRLTEKLKRLEEQRKAPEMGLGAAPRPLPPDERARPDDEPVREHALPGPPLGTRVTILLVMEPGTTGIRRYGRKTADPVLCIGKTCWVSAGPNKGAVEMVRGRALGPGNTLGRRAAACNQRLACIYRNVDLKTEQAPLQPIDLRILRHDRRQALTVKADRSCGAAGGRLRCETVFQARGWRAWVVPEALAERVGAEALEGALLTGLPRSATLADRVQR